MQPGQARNEILSRNEARWDDDNPLFIGSLSKAMRVLYAFGGDEARLTATQIAKLSGLDPSSAQRFIYTLTALGFLRRDERTKQYRLSARLLDFAYLYLRSDPLCSIANAHLNRLAHATGEGVNLSILDRADVIYVSRFAAADERNTQRLIGGRMPSHLTSNGRVLLAALPREAAEAIVRAADRRPLTAYSLTDPDEIMARIDQARVQGYAHVADESEVGIFSIAAPVSTPRAGTVAALNMPLSARKWDEQRATAELLPELLAVADTIGRSLQAIEL